MNMSMGRRVMWASVVGVLVGALGGGACFDPTGVTIPQASVESPPQTFDELAPQTWRAAWGKGQDSFGRYVEEQKAEGYRPHVLELYRYEEETLFAGIFIQDYRAWQGRWRQTWSEFDRDFKILMDKGYQPVELEIINEYDDVRYSSVWIENPGGPHWVMRWGLNFEQSRDEIRSWRRKGYRATDVEIYAVDGKTRYAYIMIHDPEKSDWEIVWGLSKERMKEEMNRLLADDYRVADFEASYPQGDLQLSAVFVRDEMAWEWSWRTCRSSGEISDLMDEMRDGHRPTHLAVGPHEEGGLIYVWLWMVNAYDW